MFFSVSLRYTNKRACPESCRAAKYDEECQILRVMGFHGFLAMLMTVGGWENRTDFFFKKKTCSEENQHSYLEHCHFEFELFFTESVH